MGMKQTIEVLNRMEADGVIGRYCIAGAVAALNYVEASATEDLDILVSFEELQGQPKSGLLTLQPIVSYLAGLGYAEFRKEGLVIEGWPVQFLPVANDLDKEALQSAKEVTIDLHDGDVMTRLLRAEHVVANALKTGRPKDRVRILQFLEAGAVETDELCTVLRRHALLSALAEFCLSAGIANPCMVKSSP